MLTKRFLPAFFILCVLLVGCAFATSSGQPKTSLPFTVIAADVENVVVIYEGEEDERRPLYAVLMGVGEERTLKGLVVSGDVVTSGIITSRKILWTTDNWGVAKIAGQERESDVMRGSQIVVQALGEGTATITAVSEEDPTAVPETCVVYVQNAPVPVEKVQINKEEIGILSGYTDELTASVLPPHADMRHITWHSSNPEIVAIDPTMRTGNRTRLLTSGLHTGTAIISAVSNYSGKRGEARLFATCTVRHYVEGPRSTEGGCSATSAPGILGLLLLTPLLLFLKK